MTAKYRIVPFVFDLEAFSQALSKVDKAWRGELAEILEIDSSTLENWIAGDYKKRAFKHPAMGNFLKVCNWLDLDPRDFFVLEI